MRLDWIKNSLETQSWLPAQLSATTFASAYSNRRVPLAYSLDMDWHGTLTKRDPAMC
jgi:hypothetical protein